MGGLLSKGIEYEADGMTVRQCLFCDIAADKPGLRQTAVAFEDDKVRFVCVDDNDHEPSSISLPSPILHPFIFHPHPHPSPPSIGGGLCPPGAMRLRALAGRTSGSPS